MQSKGKGKVNPERQRLRFSAEFKREAVRLLELGQKPATQLALELGVARGNYWGRVRNVSFEINLPAPLHKLHRLLSQAFNLAR